MPTAPVAATQLDHAGRGRRLEVGLRSGLVVFVWVALVLAPPDAHAGWCLAVAVAYLVLWVVMVLWGSVFGWAPLVLDIVVLTALTMLAGVSARDSWTAYIVVNGFFVVPVLTATQLSRRLGVALAAPTVAAYALSSVTTRDANDEPWASVGLRIALLVLVCAGSVSLSRIQRSQVRDIVALAADRADLLGELSSVEERERRDLSERLHDGALQYVLGARLDLDDVRDGSPDAVDRVDGALATSAGLLRQVVSDLHPAVLDRRGVTPAVQDLAAGLRSRGLRVETRTDGMPDRPATSADRVLYAAVRELVANVVKHADARSVCVEVRAADGRLTAEVTDDGRGFDPQVVAERLGHGHIGLTSQRLRVQAAGGSLVVSPGDVGGTRATVTLPDQP